MDQSTAIATTELEQHVAGLCHHQPVRWVVEAHIWPLLSPEARWALRPWPPCPCGRPRRVVLQLDGPLI